MTTIRPSGWFYWLFGLVILFGAAVVYREANALQTQNASFRWPTATGTVFQSSRIYGGDHERADVVYRYEVDGTRYIARQISLWSPDLSSWVSSHDIQRFVSAHPVGSEVTVYYDPKQFGNAVLIPGAYERGNEFVMGAAGVCIIAAIIGMLNSTRRRRVLEALLNAPDAQTRTINMRKCDIEKGLNGFQINSLIALGFMVPAFSFLTIPFLRGPPILLEAQPATPTWQLIAGVACVLGFLFFVICAVRRSRGAQCPLCRNLLGKVAIRTARCGDCGTRIFFEDQFGHSNQGIAQVATEQTPRGRFLGTSSVPRAKAMREFQIDRFVDVAGFMAVPILFVWLLAAFDRMFDYGIALLFTIIFCVIGALYYVSAQTSTRTKKHSRAAPPEEDSQGVETEEKYGPYLLDFSIILSAPVILLCYLLCFTWQHRVLDLKSLTVVTIAFPAAIGVVTYICKIRFIRATKLKTPKPPAFVPLSLLSLWIVGTFISLSFLVWLVYRLVWIG